MDWVDLVLSRRSIRRYETRKIPQEVLDKILEAGRKAPTADNRQPWHFIVITDPEIKEKLLQDEYNVQAASFIKEAPVTIVGCGLVREDEYTQKWGTIYSILDTTIALQNMVIAAWAMGIGSCWIGVQATPFDDIVRRLLKIPKDWKIIALISFGYPAKQPGPIKKKSIEEIVSYNTFEEKTTSR
jgi:nitroreductase